MWIGSPDELAQLVRDQRKRQRISQQKLSELADVSRQWIIALERGKPGAELGLVLRTLTALGLGIDVRDRARAGDAGGAALSDATAQVLERARAGGAQPRRLATRPPPRP